MNVLQVPSKISQQRFGPGFVRPAYGTYCFSAIPESVALILGCTPTNRVPLPADSVAAGLSKAKSVVIVLVDGFGWRFLERYQGLVPVSETLQGSLTTCITSQFPSTTAAHLTTLHSGVPVTESGIYEWFYHEPIAGRLIAPLPFNAARVDYDGRCQLFKLGITPEQIAPWPSLYQELAQRGAIESFVYHSGGFAGEKSSMYSTRGATVRPIDCVEHGFSLLRTDLAARSDRSSRSYHLLYLPEFDGMCHEYGPQSEKLVRSAERIFAQIVALKGNLPPDTVLMITADHGHTYVDPTTTIYLDALLPELPSFIELSTCGEPLVPAGSARDFFLHIQPAHREAVRSMLKQRLRGIAEVYSFEEMEAHGIWGAHPTSRLRERVGDTVVLPHEGHTVWWSEKGRFKMSFSGHHGGLTADEMLIPLITFRS